MAKINMTNQDFENEMVNIYRKLFISTPCREYELHNVFRAETETKKVVFPIGTQLDRKYFSALVEAAEKVGDEFLYISLLDCPQNEPIIHWKMPFSYPEYNNDNATSNRFYKVLESLYYSPSGLWGLAISYFDLGILGGSELFAKFFFENLGETEEDHLAAFIEYNLGDGSWFKEPHKSIKEILLATYGEEQARLIINKYGI
ncbi:MAG: hypothetical protein Fur0022_09130 [Anaerolineales bacterium]